jgi:hypothetical protein
LAYCWVWWNAAGSQLGDDVRPDGGQAGGHLAGHFPSAQRGREEPPGRLTIASPGHVNVHGSAELVHGPVHRAPALATFT